MLADHVDGFISDVQEVKDVYDIATDDPDLYADPDEWADDADDAEDIHGFRREYGEDADAIREYAEGLALEIDGETIVITTGGPHIEIDASGSTPTVKGYWSGKEVVRRPYDAAVNWFVGLFTEF